MTGANYAYLIYKKLNLLHFMHNNQINPYNFVGLSAYRAPE
jgi:hypothetical protein